MPFLNDLFWVGSSKPLGYLPISTIEGDGKSPGEIAEWANSAGLHSQRLSELECHVGSGAVYVWDESALEALLRENADILGRSGWPIAPSDFVLRVATENAHDPALYELVGVAFNDFRFREKREYVRAVSLTNGDRGSAA